MCEVQIHAGILGHAVALSVTRRRPLSIHLALLSPGRAVGLAAELRRLADEIEAREVAEQWGLPVAEERGEGGTP
jgi:hypothetical protein